jgi:hypothetical protein
MSSDSPIPQSQKYNTLDEEQNEILKEMDNSLVNLKQTAIDMGKELKSQETDMETINVGVDDGVVRTQNLNSKLKKMLNNKSYQLWCILFLGLALFILVLVIIYGNN